MRRAALLLVFSTAWTVVACGGRPASTAPAAPAAPAEAGAVPALDTPTAETDTEEPFRFVPAPCPTEPQATRFAHDVPLEEPGRLREDPFCAIVDFDGTPMGHVVYARWEGTP